jgi:hypothetical protein
MAFNVEGALKDGYSRAEIADYLASKNKFDAASARKDNYSDDEIIAHLLKKDASAPSKPAEPTTFEGKVDKDADKPGFIESATKVIKDVFTPNSGSVMDNAPPVDQQAEIDKRLALGQGPISPEAVTEAQNIREGKAPRVVTPGVGRVVSALNKQGAPTLTSTAQRVQEEAFIAQDAQAAREADLAKERQRLAREFPITSSAAAGGAGLISGVANAPSVAADLFNQTFINPILSASGFKPMDRTPTAFGTEFLAKSASDFTPYVSKQGMEDAYKNDEFGRWLVSKIAANSPQMAMSLAAAFAPPLRAALLPTMGATAAGQSYAQGEDSAIAAAKGLIEVGTEMLPLKLFDKIPGFLKGLSVPKQNAVMAIAGQRLLQAGTAITANSLTNAIEETAAQFGGNVLDKYFQGKDIELTNQLGEAAVIGAATGGAMSAPQAVTALAGGYQPLTPEQEIARTIDQSVANIQPVGTREAAVASLNPQTYDQTLISLEQATAAKTAASEARAALLEQDKQAATASLQQAATASDAIAAAEQLAGDANDILGPVPAPVLNMGRIEPTLGPVAEIQQIPGRVEPTMEAPVLPVPSLETSQQLDQLRLAPRPQRINGQPVANLSDAQLQEVVRNDVTPAITRRGAQVELDARARETTTEAPSVEDNFISIPEAGPAAMPNVPVAQADREIAAAEARAAAQQSLEGWAAANNVEVPAQLNPAPDAETAGINQIADALDSQFGGKLYAYHDTNPTAMNGVALGGQGFINTANVDINVTRTTLHEFKHTVEQIALAEARQGLTDTPAQRFVAAIDSLYDDNLTEKGKRAYLEKFLAKAELAGITDPAAREARIQELLADPVTRSEMTADFLGNRAVDKQFWADVAQADPEGFKGFVEKWLSIIDNLMATLRGKTTQGRGQSAKVDAYMRDLAKAKMVAREALIAYRKDRTQGEQRETNIPAGVEGVQQAAERGGPVPAKSRRSELPSYGEPIEGAISVVGRHYSPRVQTSLSGNYYGTGIRGAEAGRLRQSTDSRIGNRIYFYVDTGKGIRPESGVGRFAHEVQLNNIYDPATRLIAPQPNANAFESAVIDAGFDGYIAPFGNGGAVVLLGNKHDAVPVQSLEEAPAFAKRQKTEEKTIEPEKDLGTFRSVADALGLSEAEYKATALGLMTGKTKSEAFETPFVGGIPPVVEWLDKRYRDAGMSSLDLNKPEDRTTVAKMMAAEAIAAIKSAGNAVEWYDETVRRTLSTMAVKYPELNTDQNARNAFLIATAISSQTMNVEDNLRYASNQYEAFRKTGKFPEVGTGKSAPAMGKNFALANSLLEEMGPDLLRRFLQTEFTKRELESIGFKISGESMNEKMLGSAVFGPKIGFGFYSNLSGNFEPVTMDMWFMRTIGRLTGKLPAFDEKLFAKQVANLRSAIAEKGDSSRGLFAADFDRALVDEAMKSDDGAIALARAVNSLHNRQFIKERAKFDSKERYKTNLVGAAGTILKSADKPKDSPGGGGERQRLRDVVRQMVELVEQQTGKRVPPAALQALIWYPEQELYKKLGVKLRVTSQDYAGAAKSLLTKEGFDGKRISAAAESGSGPARQMAGGKVAGPAAKVGAKGESTGPLKGKEREAFVGPRVAEKLAQEAKAKPLTELFAGLNKRGLAKTRAEAAVKVRPDAAQINYVQDNFLDILSELEDSGAVSINCD